MSILKQVQLQFNFLARKSMINLYFHNDKCSGKWLMQSNNTEDVLLYFLYWSCRFMHPLPSLICCLLLKQMRGSCHGEQERHSSKVSVKLSPNSLTSPPCHCPADRQVQVFISVYSAACNQQEIASSASICEAVWVSFKVMSLPQQEQIIFEIPCSSFLI